MPSKASELLDMLGVEKERRSLTYARLCADESYGKSFIDLRDRNKSMLFPPLANEA